MNNKVSHACRSCGGKDLFEVIALGKAPLADRFVNADTLSQADLLLDLDVDFCRTCTLVQVRDVPPPEIIFNAAYPYFSSVSKTLRDQARQLAGRLIDRTSLDEAGLVVEIASNDGYLLEHFKDAGISVLGIDPAPGPVKAAREKGIACLNTFFSETVAGGLVAKGNMADLLIANNVLAHVPDPNDFMRGVARLLAPDGLAVFEVGYACDLFATRAFDTIYHEHQCYFTLHALKALLERHGLHLLDVEHIGAQGGSLRVLARHGPCDVDATAVAAMLKEERACGVLDGSFAEGFSDHVAKLCATLKSMLVQLAADGHVIAAHGAAAKGTMLLHAAGIGADLVDYIVDMNPHKQGLFMPATRIPIVSADTFATSPPDYLLILPWNLADEIIASHADFARRGGKFIIPIPEPRILGERVSQRI